MRWIVTAVGVSALACGGLPSGAPPVSRLAPPLVEIADRPSDCTIGDPGAWEPVLAARQSEGSAPNVARGNHAIAETLTLNDGVEVRVSRGGCNHLDESWSIAPAPAGPPYAALRDVLGRVALAPDPNLAVPGCLDAAPADGSGFSCGEGYVSTEEVGEVLVVTYVFAL